jgi:signal transduction histidine kinase/ActR/RegA family two-component response regulator
MNRIAALRRRGLATFVPLVVLTLLLTGFWIIFQNEQGYREGRLAGIQVQAEILAGSVTAALDFGDQGAAQEMVDAVKASPAILMAGVYDARGVRFAGFARNPGVLPDRLSATTASGGSPFEATVPVMRSGTRIGTVHLAGVIEPLSRRLSRYAIIALLVVMTSLVLAVLAQGQQALRRANRSLAEANSELQIQMEERIRAEEQLREAQKMQALGQLTGGIAHDFNNLLAVIQGAAEILQRPNLSEERRMKFTTAIIESTSRGALLTGQLLTFARRQSLRPELLDINQRIRNMLVILQPTLGPNIRVETRLAEIRPVEVDPAQFEAAILNIIVNARDAMPEGGEISIQTRIAAPGETAHGGQAVVVSIEDNGGGIAPDDLARVFEPFFTTKTVGKGTGLGLSQVYGFAAQSGGEARIESEIGKGTTLTLLLPASDQTLPAGQMEAEPVVAHEPGGRILLVEDNEEVGNLAETMLDELGHEVIRARNAHEALDIADRGMRLDLVFSDVVRPGMSGLELAGELKQRHPGLPIILTTGYSDKIAATGSSGFAVIRKPYRMEALAAAVDEVLAAARAA